MTGILKRRTLLALIVILQVFFAHTESFANLNSPQNLRVKVLNDRNFIKSKVFGSKDMFYKTSIIADSNYCETHIQFIYCSKWSEKYTTGVYEIIMEKGVRSIVFEVRPNDYKRTILYSNGHEPINPSSRFFENIDQVLMTGSRVFLFSMPFVFPNKNTILVNIKNLGNLEIGPEHNEIALLEGSIKGSPLKYFVQPEIIIVNKVIQKNESVAMAGLSGGGWTTTFVSAIEPRISLSYSIAGTLPFTLKTEVNTDLGDWEQWLIGLIPRIGYKDLYISGTFPNRKVVNVYNSQDPCCFSIKSNTLDWVDQVRLTTSIIGGEFDVIVEDSDQHDFGPAALEQFLLEIKNLP